MGLQLGMGILVVLGLPGVLRPFQAGSVGFRPAGHGGEAMVPPHDIK